jgi:hypothetical protein
MVDAVNSTQNLHRIVLSWDYYDILEKLDAQGGIYESVRAVPSTFKDLKARVHGVSACMAHGHGAHGAQQLLLPSSPCSPA